MWYLFKEYHNPFFPFLNSVFQSEYWADNNYYDKRFIPQNLLQLLTFPFNYRRNGNSFFVWDYRLGFCLAAVFALWVFSSFSKKIRLDEKFKFLIWFWTSSYFIWISFFAISRYLIPLELAGAVILVKTAEILKPKTGRYLNCYEWLICILFFVLLLNPLVSGKYGCRNCSLDGKRFNKFMEIESGIEIPDNTLLLFYYDPGAAVLPYLSRQAKNLKGVYVKKQDYKQFCNGTDVFNEIDYWVDKWQKIIAGHNGLSVGVIAYQNDETVQDMLKKEELLKGMVCKKFKSNIMPWYHFCVDATKQSEIFR